MIQVFVCGIQKSIEDQRKVAVLRIPQQIWFWPVADSAYNAENAQFVLVMADFTFTKLDTNTHVKITIFIVRLNASRNLIEEQH